MKDFFYRVQELGSPFRYHHYLLLDCAFVRPLHSLRRTWTLLNGWTNKPSMILSVSVRFCPFLSVSVCFCLFLSVSVCFCLFLSVSVCFCNFLSVSVLFVCFCLFLSVFFFFCFCPFLLVYICFCLMLSFSLCFVCVFVRCCQFLTISVYLG